MNRKNLGILLFPDVEVLDFAGPFEVFSVTDELNNHELFNVFTLAQNPSTIIAKNGLQVIPDFVFENHPVLDYLVVPGGFGTRALLQDEETMMWLKKTAKSCEKTVSICSGALLLAQAGLLDNLKATTHHEVFDELMQIAPRTEIIKNQRFIDNGSILTSGGISAGIDMSFYLVEQLFGELIALKTAKYMEYSYLPCKTVA